MTMRETVRLQAGKAMQVLGFGLLLGAGSVAGGHTMGHIITATFGRCGDSVFLPASPQPQVFQTTAVLLSPAVP